jgi:hypothetical protein
MKSLTLTRNFILFSLTIFIFLSNFTQSVNKNTTTNKQNLRSMLVPAVPAVPSPVLKPQTATVTSLKDEPKVISPIIETNRQIADKFEKVTYVKEISVAGRAALELRNSGE